MQRLIPRLKFYCVSRRLNDSPLDQQMPRHRFEGCFKSAYGLRAKSTASWIGSASRLNSSAHCQSLGPRLAWIYNFCPQIQIASDLGRLSFIFVVLCPFLLLREVYAARQNATEHLVFGFHLTNIPICVRTSPPHVRTLRDQRSFQVIVPKHRCDSGLALCHTTQESLARRERLQDDASAFCDLAS